MHQIPPKPEALRVRVWRTLQRIGATPVKNSVYALPNIPFSRKVLSNLAKEIESGGGEAILCESEFLQGVNSAALIEDYNKLLEDIFLSLKKELTSVKKILIKKNQADFMAVEHSLGRIRSLLKEASERNAFGCKSEKYCYNLLMEIEKTLSKRVEKNHKKTRNSYQNATWVTRKDVRVDRMASAWLIKRYIDPEAKFLFVDVKTYHPAATHLRFDMFKGEFTHEGDLCTFEVLLKKFNLNKNELVKIGQIIHDLDIQDARYEHEETSGIQVFLKGLSKRIPSDHERLQEAFSFFDSLAVSFQ
jgi:hypothetical protein